MGYAGVQDKLFYAPGIWDFYRCSNAECGILWLNPRPQIEIVRHAYSNYYTHESGRMERGVVAQFLSASLRLAVTAFLRLSGLAKEEQNVSDMHLGELKPGRLLDVGCGAGEFIYRMEKRGWSVCGLDFDVHAGKVAEQRYGLKVNICDAEKMSYPTTVLMPLQ